MARLLPSISNHSHLSFFSIHFTSLIALIAALFSIFALVIFLCASSSRKPKKSNRMQRNFVSKINSNISSRAVSMAKMISWRKVEAADEDEDEEEEKGDCDVSDDDDNEVWRKTIIKGERCRPLEFSGKIDYDSEGNLLSDSNRNSNSVG